MCFLLTVTSLYYTPTHPCHNTHMHAHAHTHTHAHAHAHAHTHTHTHTHTHSLHTHAEHTFTVYTHTQLYMYMYMRKMTCTLQINVAHLYNQHNTIHRTPEIEYKSSTGSSHGNTDISSSNQGCNWLTQAPMLRLSCVCTVHVHTLKMHL